MQFDDIKSKVDAELLLFTEQLKQTDKVSDLAQPTKYLIQFLTKTILPNEHLHNKLFPQSQVNSRFDECLQRFQQRAAEQKQQMQNNLQKLQHAEQAFECIAKQTQKFGQQFQSSADNYKEFLQKQSSIYEIQISEIDAKKEQMYDKIQQLIDQTLLSFDQHEVKAEVQKQECLESNNANQIKSQLLCDNSETSSETEVLNNKARNRIKQIDSYELSHRQSSNGKLHYYLSPQYMPEHSKIQDMKSYQDQELSYSRYLIGFGYQDKNIEFYFVFSDGSKFPNLSADQEFTEYLMTDKQIESLNKICLQYRNHRTMYKSQFTGIKLINYQGKTILSVGRWSAHNSNYAQLDISLQKGDRVIGIQSGSRSQQGNLLRHFDLQLIIAKQQLI